MIFDRRDLSWRRSRTDPPPRARRSRLASAARRAPVAVAVALCGSFLFPATVGAEHVWEVILNPRALTADSVGCSNSHSDVAKHCSNAGHNSKILGQNPITIGGTAYTITEMRLTSSSLTIEFDPAPPAGIDGWRLNANGYVKTLRRQSGGIVTTDALGLNWPEGSWVKIRLDDPRLPHDPDSEFLSAGSRSEAHCRDATKDDETKGYWHCHGDSVVHQHAEPHWSQPHRPPTHTADKCTVETHTTTTTVGTTTTTLPSVWHCHTDGTYHAHALARSGHNHATAATDGGPEITLRSKPATQAERDAGFGSGWHSHNEPGYNVHHRHGTGEHPH